MFYPSFKSSVTKFIQRKESQIDGTVFNVHCKITAILLFLASTIITTQMNVGKPIQCISDIKAEDRQKVVDTFCWVNSTFRLVPDLSPYDDSGSPYPSNRGPSEETYYAYYQWVGFVLFFQALLFYGPKWFWKLSEGKLMATLLAVGSRKYEEGEERKKKAQSLTNYFTERLKRHRSYAITYWLMELLCLCNVILQTIGIDKFLGGKGQFLSYGLRFSFTKLNLAGSVVTVNGGGSLEEFNELDLIFPLQTKCSFRYYGAGGSPQLVDALCILFLNIYNRCIFAVMWYWFSLLLLMLTSLLIYRLALIFSPSLRILLLRTSRKGDLNREIRAVVQQLPVTDWWVLYMLKANIDVNLYKDLISELFHDLQMSKKMRDSDE